MDKYNSKKWIKFSEEWPEIDEIIIFFDKGDYGGITIAQVVDDKSIFAAGFMCNTNSKECVQKYNECGCALVINKDCYWMYLPNLPLEPQDMCAYWKNLKQLE